MSGPNPCPNCGLSECFNAPPGADKKLARLLSAAKALRDLDKIGYNPAALKANGSGYPDAIRELRNAIDFAEGRGTP